MGTSKVGKNMIKKLSPVSLRGKGRKTEEGFEVGLFSWDAGTNMGTYRPVFLGKIGSKEIPGLGETRTGGARRLGGAGKDLGGLGGEILHLGKSVEVIAESHYGKGEQGGQGKE